VGAPAIVMGDKVTGMCAIHQIPNPASGVPQPGPPMPFSAPITTGTVATAMNGGKPAAVVGCSGMNTPPHVGLHPADPYMAPPQQMGRIVSGSPTVTIGGKPAATAQSSATCCVTPGSLVPTVTTVLIG
jgi:uncharacterized Zn-binding protein involved in type VI secretion